MKRKAILLLISLTCLFRISAQEIGGDDVNRSPYFVIYNHLYYLQPDNYDPTLAARSLMPNSPASAKDDALRLKEVMDGMGLYIDINRLPQASDYYDSIRREAVYVLSRNEPRIYVEKVNGQWRYSETTLNAIDDMYGKIYPLNGSLRSYFQSPGWHKAFLGIQAWQWLTLGLLLVGALLFFYVINWIIRRIGHRIARLQISTQDNISGAISRLTKVLSLLLTIMLSQWLLPAIHLTPRLNSILIKGLEVMEIVFVILIVMEIANLLFSYLHKWAEGTESTMDDQLMPLLSRLADIVIWAVGIIYILDYLEINITALLAGISIGGLAIALAAQDTVKNFFGSIMIFLDKPFQIGDWISFDGVDGVVERVGVRSTRIRTFANSLTYVPNGIFAEKVIDNKGLRIYRRYTTEIGITYDTPTYLIDMFVEGIEQLIREHPYTRKDSYEVVLNKFGSSSLNILLYAFFAVDNWTDELRGKHDIMKGIINLAEAIGVRFAFPSQTIYIEEMPGKPSLTPSKKSPQEARSSADEILEEITSAFKERAVQGEKEKQLGGDQA